MRIRELWRQGNRLIQVPVGFGITTQESIGIGQLYLQERVARIELEGFLEGGQGVVESPLPAADVSDGRQDIGIALLPFGNGKQLLQRPVVVLPAPIVIVSQRQVSGR